MSITINKRNTIYAIFVSLILLLASCANDKSKPNEDHAHEHEDAEHDEGEGAIASLTLEQMKSVGIALGKVEQRELNATVKANGYLRVPNNNRANATSLFSGMVKNLKVQLGDYVQKGQLLAILENPQYVQLQEDYLASGNELVLAEQELERQKELLTGNAGTARNLQNASSKVNGLGIKKASLAQQLRMMGINPNNLSSGSLKTTVSVLSPISGVVSNVFVKIGSYVDVSTAMVEIVDNSLLHLDLQVFERDLSKIRIGQSIDFTLTNNPERTYRARVSRIGASFENESKTIAVHCLVEGNKDGLIDGMNISGIVAMQNITSDVVPNEAVVESGGKSYIFVQKENYGKEKDSHGNGKEDNHDHNGEGEHQHSTTDNHEHESEEKDMMRFEKVEVVKGVTSLGYTGITSVVPLPKDSKIVIKGAFFINAKLSGTVGHSH